jgi:hypothetical protein
VIRTVFHATGEIDGKTDYVTSTAAYPLASLWE